MAWRSKLRENMWPGKKRAVLKKSTICGNLAAAFLIVVLFVLSYGVGTVGGDLAYRVDNGLITRIDAEYFKEILRFEIPLIDIVYNSGRISFTGQVRTAVRMLYGIKAESPVSILGAGSASFKSYYNGEYRQKMAQAEKDDKKPVEEHSIEEETSPDKDEGIEEEQNQYRQIASSILFKEDETKDMKNSETIEKGTITVLNETGYAIDRNIIDSLMEQPNEFDFDRKGPSVLIYHTHTTEAYIRDRDDLYREVAVRSRDEKYNVVRVGEELAQILENRYGIDVIHNGTVHDYPEYNKSYLNAADTLEKYLKSYPSIKIAIDIHRDAAPDGQKLRVVKEVDGKNAARVMFVVGTDARGLEHPEWKNNLKLAVMMQQRLNAISPGLAKHIYISKNRYNQHMADGSLLIEIGGDGNLLEECLYSCRFLAEALSEVIKGSS